MSYCIFKLTVWLNWDQNVYLKIYPHHHSIIYYYQFFQFYQFFRQKCLEGSEAPEGLHWSSPLKVSQRYGPLRGPLWVLSDKFFFWAVSNRFFSWSLALCPPCRYFFINSCYYFLSKTEILLYIILLKRSSRLTVTLMCFNNFDKTKSEENEEILKW